MVYRPSHFDEPRHEILTAFMRQYAFATLVSTGASGLVASHIPLLYEPERGPQGTLLGHLARANPQLADLRPGSEVLAIFHGPHAYVSPRWYATEPSVPTWNYATVHAYGTVEPIDDPERLAALVGRLAEVYESGSARPWRMDEAPDSYIRGMLRGITGFAIAVTRLEGKFKLSQNRDAADRARVTATLAAGNDQGGRDVAALMAEREAGRDKPRP